MLYWQSPEALSLSLSLSLHLCLALSIPLFLCWRHVVYRVGCRLRLQRPEGRCPKGFGKEKKKKRKNNNRKICFDLTQTAGSLTDVQDVKKLSVAGETGICFRELSDLRWERPDLSTSACCSTLSRISI